MKKVFLVLFLLATLLCGCEKDEKEEIISSIQLSETSLILQLDQKHQLVVSHIPESLPSPKYNWESSDTDIIKIIGEGLIEGVGVGVCNVTVSTLDGKLKSQISVTVSPVEASSISLNLSETSLFVGETSKLRTTILPENTTNKEVEWSTENSEIATVDNGFVTAISKGKTNIIVKLQGTNIADTCKIKIENVEASSIILSPSEVSLYVGETSKLMSTILPKNTTIKEVEWSTENSEIAKVDDGLVTAISEGETNIIVKVKGTDKTDTCKIKIDSYFKELNKEYVAKDSLTVKMVNLCVIKNKENVISYYFVYTLKNETSDKIISEGTFKIFYKNRNEGENQYGFFGKLYPGESITRSYTFKTIASDPFKVLEYGSDNFFREAPIIGSLKWDAELK